LPFGVAGAEVTREEAAAAADSRLIFFFFFELDGVAPNPPLPTTLPLFEWLGV
jgi:hypothetical protein